VTAPRDDAVEPRARGAAWQLALPALVGVALLVLGRVTPLGAWAAELAERMRSTGAEGALAFAGIYVLATLAAMPVALLTAAAGFAYGPLRAAALVLPVSVAAATLAFFLGRTFLRSRMEAAIATSPRLRALVTATEDQGFRMVLCMRLAMIFPFSLLNFALGATKVRARDFVVASLLGCVPSTLLYAYLASLVSSAGELETTLGMAPTWLVLSGTIVGASAVFVLVHLALRAMRKPSPA